MSAGAGAGAAHQMPNASRLHVLFTSVQVPPRQVCRGDGFTSIHPMFKNIEILKR